MSEVCNEHEGAGNRFPVGRVKVDLVTLPRNMQSLPVDHRGYPVPWFVAWIDGRPEFRAMDPHKWMAAVKQSRCWVCGYPLGYSKCFVAGPMCGINRTTGEPPCHPECARWSARNCPFLANPRMVRREDEVINNQTLKDNSPGIALARNPGVTMLWFTRSFDFFLVNQKPLITIGTPVAVEWWAEGKPATREQVDDSIAGGLPSLEALARSEQGGIEALREAIRRFEKWLPAA